MQTRPLLTFIVPVYHIPQAWLCECLQSLFGVGLKDNEFEIIVVDDGNDTDITLGWSEAWRQSICCIHQANQGLSVARNEALKRAQGEYIQFVDSDDYLEPSLYKRLLGFAVEQQADLLSFHLYSSEKEKQTNFSKQLLGPMTGAHFMERHNLRPAACGYLFKKSLLGALQFTPQLLHEDEEFTPQLFLKARRSFHTTATPYYYRVRHGSITHHAANDYYTKHAPCVERILMKLHSLPVPPQHQKALARRVDQLTLDYLYNLMLHTQRNDQLEQAMKRLRGMGVYPTSAHCYNAKYVIFRFLVLFAPTRRLLTKILRKQKR